jgi:hypothetical protein
MNKTVTPGDTTLNIIKRQFAPALQMLEDIISHCPEELWRNNHFGRPLWKRMLHALESVDFFLNDFDRYHFHDIGKEVSAEFDVEDMKDMSKEEMSVYFGKVKSKCLTAFTRLNDTGLLEQSPTHPEYTFLDIFMMQLRHLALNTGRCNEALAANGKGGSGWIGYAE